MTEQQRHEAGAALVVCLILLATLSAIGISSMSTATIELTLARNLRFQQAAFEAASAGIERALATASFSLRTPMVLSGRSGIAAYSATISFSGTTEVPHGGFSLGDGSGALAAYHFEVFSTGTAPRNAAVSLRQGFYIISPVPRAGG